MTLTKRFESEQASLSLALLSYTWHNFNNDWNKSVQPVQTDTQGVSAVTATDVNILLQIASRALCSELIIERCQCSGHV